MGMLHKTKGIVLSYLKYRESSIIAKIYTETFGVQSYVINGVRSSRAKSNKIALFQPLTLLDMVVYHKSHRETLQRLSEVRNAYPFTQLPFDMVRTSVALFLAELLGKCLKEEEANELLFHFLEESVILLDQTDQGLESFHLVFMVQLASYLGFGIESTDQFKEVLRGFKYSFPDGDHDKGALESIILEQPEGLKKAGRVGRNILLAQLLFYYRVHLDHFGEIKSLDVLKAVLH